MNPRVLCAVGGHADELFVFRAPSRHGQSVPATMRASAGGCALNVACGLAGLGARVTHAGLRGEDAGGAVVARTLARHGVADAALVLPGEATGRYAAMVEPDGALALAAAAMDIYAHAARLADHAPFRDALAKVDALLLDANGPPGAAEALATEALAADALAAGRGGALALLATSAPKAPVLADLMPRADAVFANAGEWAVLEAVRDRIALAFVTDGANDARAFRLGHEVARAAPPHAFPFGPLVDVVGGGDAFAAGALHAHLTGSNPGEALERGLRCAARCVAREGALGWLDDAEDTP